VFQGLRPWLTTAAPPGLRYTDIMSSSPDVLILGGGVIGLTMAYHLAKEGVRVEIVDRGDLGQEASWAGAGMIPPAGNPRLAPSPYDQLLSLSSEMFWSFTCELSDCGGVDSGYCGCGSIVFLDEDDKKTAAAWRKHEIDFEVLEGEKLHHLEPGLNRRFHRGYFLHEYAQVRNPRYVKSLIAACLFSGVTFRPGCPVHALERSGDRITAVQSAAGRLTAEKIVIAAGAWSDSLLAPVGCRLGIRPVRGQIVLLNTRWSNLSKILEVGKRYVVPRGDGRVLIGSTEEDAGFDKHTTAQAIRALLDFALDLAPVLADASIERTWAGLRPGSPDGMPFLGAVPGLDNLFVASGHFRAGIQLSPITGLLMKQLLLGQKLTMSIEHFSPQR
jgi:glycine oxidase